MLKESYIKQMREIAPDEHSLTMTAVCGFIALLSFVGNLLLCVVILKRRSMLAKPYNVLIFNLAVTDMLTGEVFFAVPFFFHQLHPTDPFAEIAVHAKGRNCFRYLTAI